MAPYGFCSVKFKKLFSLEALSNLIFSVITAREVSVCNEIIQRFIQLFMIQVYDLLVNN